ncbi:hypothetical protein [Streptomyces sp. 4N124]|uniref:hypothetical protein n=1 Tax=Streptomyces sp. 4N124 TaxID=3457420 RepID=UPI003FD2760E
MITPQLNAESFTKTDVDEFHKRMTELVRTCQSVADQYPRGVWEPSTADVRDQFGESMVLIAEVSRTLNRSRWGIRKVWDRARQRVRA